MTRNGYRCDHYDFTPLSTTIVVLFCFVNYLNHSYWEQNVCSSKTSRFANILSQNRQISVIFAHLKLWVTVADSGKN